MIFKDTKVKSKSILTLRAAKQYLKKEKTNENITANIRDNKKAIKRK